MGKETRLPRYPMARERAAATLEPLLQRPYTAAVGIGSAIGTMIGPSDKWSLFVTVGVALTEQGYRSPKDKEKAAWQGAVEERFWTRLEEDREAAGVPLYRDPTISPYIPEQNVFTYKELADRKNGYILLSDTIQQITSHPDAVKTLSPDVGRESYSVKYDEDKAVDLTLYTDQQKKVRRCSLSSAVGVIDWDISSTPLRMVALERNEVPIFPIHEVTELQGKILSKIL